MFDGMRFRSALTTLVMDPGVPLAWQPYGRPPQDIIRIGIEFEGGRFRDLPPKLRALKTALELLQSDLVPDQARLHLHTAALGFATKYDCFDLPLEVERRARQYLEKHGLLEPMPWSGATDKLIDTLRKP